MTEKDYVVNQKTVRRKVQVVGGNTITVSLPRSWADKNRLGRDTGMESEVAMRYMADGSLLVSPANSSKHHIERDRSHRITIETSLDKLKRIILADFMGGIDVIRIRTKHDMSPEKLHGIRDFVDKRLIGFDLIDNENGFDIINMTQSPKFHVDKLMEILRVQSKKMMQKCIQWLVDPEIDRNRLHSEISMLESSLDKRSNQMMRTLQLSILDYWMAENVNLPMSEILYWSTVTKATENAADLAVAITETAPMIDLDQMPNDVIEQMHTLGEMVTGLFSKSLKAFISHDHDMAHEVLEDQTKNSATSQKKWPIKSAEQLTGNMILILRHLEKIGVYARKIGEATIDCEAARVAYSANDINS